MYGYHEWLVCAFTAQLRKGVHPMIVNRVVVITDLCESVGGQEVLALLSARLLKDQGFEVVYVCGDYGDSAELRSLDVEVFAAKSQRLLDMPAGQAFRTGIYDRRMREFMEKVVETYDSPHTVFHVHGWAQIFSPSIFAALATVSCRTLIHAHDMTLACPNGVYMDFPRSEVCKRKPLSWDCLTTQCDKRSYTQKLWRATRQSVLSRCLERSADWAGIIAIHPQMKPMLQRFGYPHNLFHLLRNPVRPYLTKRAQVEDNESFLYVGRLEPEKGVVELAQAATRVGVPLVCIGSGSLSDWLAREFPNVVLPGRLRSEEIATWARKTRALVFPSLLPEPFGLVLAEAVHSGIPVAVSKTVLMAREIEDQSLGIEFDVKDQTGFDGVLKTFRNMLGADLLKMSQQGFEGDTRLGLSEADWVSGLIELYESSVSNAL